MTSHLGIDCGITGAMALLDAAGNVLDVRDLPTDDRGVSPAVLSLIVGTRITQHGPIVATVEQLHAMPPPVGSKANFSKGDSFGVVRAVLACHDVPITYVTPAAWKREMGLARPPKGAKSGAIKEIARTRALEMWPDIADLLARKKDADRAEALLLAEHGRRAHLQATGGEA